MKIGILSCAGRCYSTQRLREAAQNRGHQLKVFETLRFSLMLEKGRPDLLYAHRHFPQPDAIIPRIAPAVTFFGLSVVRQFEQMGVFSANEALAIARSRDKLRALQILSRHDIGIPPTAFVRDRAEVLPTIEKIGGPPVIIKILEGTQGAGVLLAESIKMAEAIIQTLHSARQNVLIQKFIQESRGRDVRALVVGDRVVAAMRRIAGHPEEFRSNLHLGGTTVPILLEAEYEQTAIRAVQILGLNVAGVDMLETSEGPLVIEVNSSPGLEGIESSTGIDVAGAIIEEIERRVNFPGIDLRQRLRLAAGYVIAEFRVCGMPEIQGRTIRETGFPKRKIHIISINRGNVFIPNPDANERIQEGDLLLCYGDLHELRRLGVNHRETQGARDRSGNVGRHLPEGAL